MIVILLVLIVCILLFGAAAIRAAIVRNLLLMLAIIPVVVLWQIVESIPSWVWWCLGGAVLAFIAFLAWDYRHHERRVEEEAKANLTAAAQRLRDHGMTEAEIAHHQRLAAEGKHGESAKFFSACMKRVAEEGRASAGTADDDRRYSEWASKGR